MGLIACALVSAGCMKEINKNISHVEARNSYYRGDYARSFRLTEALAYQGDPKAEYTLGYLYYYGIGAPANKPLGKAWIRRAAEKGFNPAIIASEQINVCDSTVVAPKAKKCVDSSRGIEATPPFEQQAAILQPTVQTAEKSLPSLEEPIEIASQGEPKQTALKNAWTIQLGTFKDVSNAVALVNKLKTAGHTAYTRNITLQGKQLTAVLVGSHANKADANQLRSSLSTSLQINGIVVPDEGPC